MRTKVKICGISEEETLVGSLSAGADAVGFVFFSKSPRAVTPEQVAPLAGRAPHILKVGLFVDAEEALIDAAVAQGKLGVLQLQGKETPERVAELKARHNLPVWKAVGVATEDEIREAEQRFQMADMLLLDAKSPAGSTRTGGHGLPFDWQILANSRPQMPWVLAGGLTPDNVAEAIRLTGAEFVDVSSGVEETPGKKSLAKIAQFIEAARRG